MCCIILDDLITIKPLKTLMRPYLCALETLNPSDLSWAAGSCQAVLTPGRLLTEPPANRSCGPHDRTQLRCR